MNLNDHDILQVPFREHPVVDFRQTEPGEFDISAINENSSPDFNCNSSFDISAYCTCILHKIDSLPHSKLEDFIEYQCEQVKDPFVWLNKLEKLIAENIEISNSKKWKATVSKMYVLIEKKREEVKPRIKNNKNGNHHSHSHSTNQQQQNFCFNKLKTEIATLPTFAEKKIKLIEARTEYLQNKPAIINTFETPFDESVELELKKLEQIELLKSTANEQSSVSNKKLAPKPTMQINGQLNIFVDAFFQMLHERKENGKPFLSATTQQITDFICNNFLDKDSNIISRDTVRTILSPNKTEKRPKQHKKINL